MARKEVKRNKKTNKEVITTSVMFVENTPTTRRRQNGRTKKEKS